MQVIDCNKYDHIISWTADGLSIVIHKPMSLLETVDGDGDGDALALVPHVISNDEDGGGGGAEGGNTNSSEPKFKSFLRKVSEG